MNSLEEYELVAENLIPGCTLDWLSNTEGLVHAIINQDETLRFMCSTFVTNWNIKRFGYLHWKKMSNFKYPDGSPMLPEDTFEKQQKILSKLKQTKLENKIKNLDTKFKTKTLPKTKSICLSFPDKKEKTKNQKENINPFSQENTIRDFNIPDHHIGIFHYSDFATSRWYP